MTEVCLWILPGPLPYPWYGRDGLLRNGDEHDAAVYFAALLGLRPEVQSDTAERMLERAGHTMHEVRTCDPPCPTCCRIADESLGDHARDREKEAGVGATVLHRYIPPRHLDIAALADAVREIEADEPEGV